MLVKKTIQAIYLILAIHFLLSNVLPQNQKAELVVQARHTSSVFAVVFSPNGILMATGSRDSTVKLWNPATGELLKTFSGHASSVYSLAFAADGKRLASLSYDKTIKLWDVERGQLIKSFPGHELNMYTGSVAFDRAGKLLERGGAGKSVKIWDAENGQEIFSLDGFASEIKTVAFSPDEKTVAATISHQHYYKIVSLYSLETREQLKSFQENSEDDIYGAFSPDGKLLALDRYYNIKILDVKTGEFIKEFKGEEDTAHVTAMAFSPDGKKIVAGHLFGGLVIWDLKTGAKLEAKKIHEEEIYSIAFTPDSKLMASAAKDSLPILWNAQTAMPEKGFGGYLREIGSVEFSPDGKNMASIGDDERTIKLWRIAEGQTLKNLEATTEVDIGGFGSWDDDTGTAAFSSLYMTGMNLIGGRGRENGVRIIKFSPDGRTLASAGNDYFIRFWDVETGTLAKSFTGHNYNANDLGMLELDGAAPFINKLAFSADGKKLASLSDEGKLRVWNTENSRLLTTVDLGKWWYYERAEENKGYIVFPTAEIAFNRVGDKAAILAENGTVRIYGVAGGQETKKISFQDFSQSVAANEFPDLIAAARKTVFTHDKKLKVEYADNGLINLLDAKTNALTATLALFNENDWLVLTPDGLFDGTPAAWENLRWRFNTAALDYVPLEAFFNDSYTPGLLKEIVEGKRPRNLLNFNRIDRRLPSVGLKLKDKTANAASIKTRQIEIEIEASEAALNSGVRDLRLFRDGSLVKIWRGDVFDRDANKDCETASAPEKPRRVICRAMIAITEGKNQLTAYAFNRDNIKSVKTDLEINGANSLRRDAALYLLSIGVNEYRNPSYNLNYAVPDASGIADALGAKQETVKKYSNTVSVSLTDKNATRENILLALRRFAGTDSVLPDGLPAEARAEIEKTKPLQPEDALLIYFAGHGTARCEANAQGKLNCDRFYLIPHDGFPTEQQREALKTDAEARNLLYSQSISDEDLERELEKIDAGKVLMIIDACNSGQALEAEEKRRGPMNSRGLAQLAYEKGMYILTASQSRQAALEVSKLKHGLLTYALLEGLQKADRDYNKNITEREWFDYAVEQVPHLQTEATRTRRAEIQKSPGKHRSGIIYLSQGGKNSKLEARALQTPRVFLPQNQSAQPFILASSQAEATKKALRWSEFFRHRKYEMLVKETTAELELNPQDAVALRMRAAVYNVQEKTKLKEQDLQRLQRIMQNPIFSAEEYESRCWLLSSLKKYSEAVNDCTQAIKLHPQLVLAYRTRGAVYYNQGDFEKALADLNRTIELDPMYSGVYYNRSFIYQKNKNYEAAIADLNKAIEISPTDADYFVQRGSIYNEREDLPRALADYNQALKLNAKNSSAYINRGNIRVKLKEFDAAIADYNKALEIKNEALIYVNRGNAYEEKGDFQQAIADYTKALQVNAEYIRASYRRGSLYLKMKNYDAALVDFNELIKTNPKSAVLYEQRALAYEGKGETALAEADKKTASELKAQPK